MEIYQQRRQQLLAQLQSTDAVILCAAPEAVRSNDAHFRYRQDNNFYYLTGFLEANSMAVLLPGREQGEFILFSEHKDPEQERWTGWRVGQQQAIEHYGADEAYASHEFSKMLPKLLSGCKNVYVPYKKNNPLIKKVFNIIERMEKQQRKGIVAPNKVCNLNPLLNEMRLFKSADEIKKMRFAAQVTAKAHIKAMQRVKPGCFEYQLEAELMHSFLDQGCQSAAYESIVASGENACILHYVNNNSECRDGDLVLIDAGAEYHHYAADVTRCFPVNGRFSQAQAAIYDIVLDAQLAAIELCKPGVAWDRLQQVITEVMTQGMLEIGLLKGEYSQLMKEQAYQQFYMHSSGHWLGLDVHDVGHYKKDKQSRLLEQNMVLTVEPGIYIDSHNTQVDPQFRGIGIRIEDDILITAQGHEVFSKDVPKRRDEIESIMKS